MTEIGKPVREHEVQPAEEPVPPERDPMVEPDELPVTVPAEEPVHAAA